jgi:hypothetical protein
MAAVVLPPGSVYALADMKTYEVQYRVTQAIPSLPMWPIPPRRGRFPGL